MLLQSLMTVPILLGPSEDYSRSWPWKRKRGACGIKGASSDGRIPPSCEDVGLFCLSIITDFLSIPFLVAF